MFASRPLVHPVEAPPLIELDNNVPRMWMKDVQGMAGTTGGLALRLFQFLSAIVSLCLMVTTSEFYSVTAFCYLVAAISLQILWSLSLAITDIYTLLVRRSLRNSGIISFFAVGDGIISTLTFSAACASAGASILIGKYLPKHSVNPCSRFDSATAMALFSGFTVSPSFCLNFWFLAASQ